MPLPSANVLLCIPQCVLSGSGGRHHFSLFLSFWAWLHKPQTEAPHGLLEFHILYAFEALVNICWTWIDEGTNFHLGRMMPTSGLNGAGLIIRLNIKTDISISLFIVGEF